MDIEMIKLKIKCHNKFRKIIINSICEENIEMFEDFISFK